MKSHYFEGFMHPSWLFGISEPSTVVKIFFRNLKQPANRFSQHEKPDIRFKNKQSNNNNNNNNTNNNNNNKTSTSNPLARWGLPAKVCMAGIGTKVGKWWILQSRSKSVVTKKKSRALGAPGKDGGPKGRVGWEMFFAGVYL